jgi:small subunit ribosomal protein S20e
MTLGWGIGRAGIKNRKWKMREARIWMNYADNYHSLNAPTEVVKQIIINIEAGVEVEVTIAA